MPKRLNTVDVKTFWDKRYQGEGHVWGDLPSKTAVYALGLFRKHGVKKVLVPGSGYGRNSRLFSESGFDVTGIDVSVAACKLAKEYDLLTKHYCQSILDISFDENKYDAIYCFNTLHLFYKKERELFSRVCNDGLKNGGLAFFTVFSENDPSFGRGLEIEKNTFESRSGRPAHYFTESDLRSHFKDFEILEAGVMEESEVHGGSPHTHVLRYILVRKPPGAIS